MAAPMTAAIPWALELPPGYTMRFTAVSPTTGATVSGVTVSGVTIEASLDEEPVTTPATDELGQIFLMPGPAVAA